MDFEINFKNVLKKLRLEKKLSQTELANIIGLTAGTIGMYESGNRNPSIKVLKDLSCFFGVSIDYLLGREINNPIEDILNKNENDWTSEELSELENYKNYIRSKRNINNE